MVVIVFLEIAMFSNSTDLFLSPRPTLYGSFENLNFSEILRWVVLYDVESSASGGDVPCGI